MKTIIPLVIFFLLVAGNAFSQEDSSHKTQQHRHMEYSKTKNPIPVTSQSVEKGGEIYKKHCAVCHGDKGKVGPDGPGYESPH